MKGAMPKIQLMPKREKVSLLKRKPALPDPLASVEYAGNVEEDAKREFTALELAFKEQAKAEKASQKYANDSEFWFCACFQSREQVEAFLQALGIDPDTKYLSGFHLAEKLGIVLEAHPEPTRSKRGLDQSLTALT